MKRKKIIFDLDGVIIDILDSTIVKLRNAAKDFINNSESNNEIARICNFRDYSKEQLVDFINLHSDTVKSWNLDPLPEHIKDSIFKLWRKFPELYSNPSPMYDTVTANHNGLNVFVCNSHTFPRPSFGNWLVLLNFLSRFVDVEIHSHTYNETMRSARILWCERTFGIDEGVHFCIDCGKEKSISTGDILVEDSLDNLLNSNVETRILHNMSYNSLKNENNLNRWISAGKPPIICYGSFTDLCHILFNILIEAKIVNNASIFNEFWNIIAT